MAPRDGEDAHKYPVQRLRVVGGGQDTRILHVALEIPELGQADARDVDDVGGIRHGHLGVRAFEGGDQRHDKVEQVLVEGEQGDQLGGRGQVLVVGQAVLVRLGLFLVLVDVFVVEALDVVDVDGDAAPVAVAGPLRILCAFARSDVWGGGQICPAYHQPGLLVCFDVKVVVELFHPLFLEPLLRVGELPDGALDIELAGSEISTVGSG